MTNQSGENRSSPRKRIRALKNNLLNLESNSASENSSECSQISPSEGSVTFSDVSGNSNLYPVTFDQGDRELLWELSTTLRPPFVFVLVLQLTRRTIELGDDRVRWISTSEIASRVLSKGNALQQLFKKSCTESWELRLLARKEVVVDGTHREILWALTHDGKRFLLNGIRSRMSMRKFARLSDDQICDQLAIDETEEWRQEALDRAIAINSIENTQADSLKNGRPHPLVGFTKTQFANSIAAHSIKQAKVAQAYIDPLWAGLLR